MPTARWVALACAALSVGCGTKGRADATYVVIMAGDAAGTVSFVSNGSEIWFSDVVSSTPIFYGPGTDPLAAPFFPDDVPPLAYHVPQVGQTWSHSYPGTALWNVTEVVESVTDDVVVPAGTFHGCVKVVETFMYGPHQAPVSYVKTRERWFAGGVGPVKVRTVGSEYHYDAFPRYTQREDIAELVSSSTPGASATDFFPLGLGYTWTMVAAGIGSATFTVTEVR
jgi:hypothetical protein